MARALVKNPELCFADEPTSALDWSAGKQVVQMMRAATHRHNTLMFVVAHDAARSPTPTASSTSTTAVVEDIHIGPPGGDAPS
ncbi:MAG: hypothetical protein U0797_19430 [Gemmataceae bacterium]